MGEEFGDKLKRLRLKAGIGLRRFAEMIDMQPSNLSAIEHSRRSAPVDQEKLREIAEALGLIPSTDEWSSFFDSARDAGSLPADLQHLADRELVPTLLRTIDNQKLSDKDIASLIDEIKSRPGGSKDVFG